MDVVLFTASSSVAYCLPLQQDFVKSSKSVLRGALGLSLALFSLSVIEVAPSHWLVLLDHGENGIISDQGNLTVTGAYEIILFGLCTGITFVLPFLVGGNILLRWTMTTMSNTTDDNKKYYYAPWKKVPWWIRYCFKFAFLLFKIIHRMVIVLWMRLFKKCLSPLTKRMFNNQQIMMLPVLASSPANNNTTQIGNNSRHNNNNGSQNSSGNISINNNNGGKKLIWFVGGISGVLITWAFLKAMGSLVISLPDESTTTSKNNILAMVVSWLCAVGLFFSSTLNGFGSVSLPYRCLAGWFLDPIRSDIVTKAEIELSKTKQNMESKIAEFKNNNSPLSDSFPLMDNNNNNNRRPARQQANPTKHTFFNFSGSSNSDADNTIQKRKLILQQEIDFLQSLIEDLEGDIVEMKYAQEQAALARTTLGKIKYCVGFIFSIVLLLRLFTASKSILTAPNKNNDDDDDPITRSLLWLMGNTNFVNDRDYNKLHQGISLLLTAVLTGSQINLFLRTIAAVNRRLASLYRWCNCSTNNKSPTTQSDRGTYYYYYYYNIHACILAALMGCYFISCVVLTKLNLPSEYGSSFEAALGGMEYLNIRTTVMNLVYCISAGISATTLGLVFGIQRQNTKRYIDDNTVGDGSSGITSFLPC